MVYIKLISPPCTVEYESCSGVRRAIGKISSRDYFLQQHGQSFYVENLFKLCASFRYISLYTDRTTKIINQSE